MYIYDRRIQEIVPRERINLNYLAPEVYYEYRCGANDYMITETWMVEKDKNILVAYNVDDDVDTIYNIRKSIFERNNVSPSVLVTYTVPPKQFKTALEYFGIEVK